MSIFWWNEWNERRGRIRWSTRTQGMDLVEEVPCPGEVHRDAGGVGCGNHFLVAH